MTSIEMFKDQKEKTNVSNTRAGEVFVPVTGNSLHIFNRRQKLSCLICEGKRHDDHHGKSKTNNDDDLLQLNIDGTTKVKVFIGSALPYS